MHNEPIHHRKVVPLGMARTILECYLDARKADLPVIQSKRWAVYGAEAIRFGQAIPERLKSKRREKSVWFTGKSKHAKTEVFDRIMKNTLGTTRFLGKPKAVDSWMLSALKRHDKKLWTDLRQAAANYKNIVGRPISPINSSFLKIYRKWLKVRKGRNLFVRGFGKFNISVAMNRLNAEYGNYQYALSPVDITAAGYELHRWSFQLLTTNRVLRKHYLRHRTFWSQNQNRLDELGAVLATTLIEENPDIAPETLLRRLEAERNRQREQYALPWNVATSSEPFPHLAAAPSIETPFGVLRPVKSSQEMMEVGRAMKNCAVGHVPAVSKNVSLLLALFDSDGTPIALGEVRYDKKAKRWMWGQRLGPENKKLQKAMYEVFQTYPLAASGVWEQDREDLIKD